MAPARPRILIADDEEGIRFVLRELLTREGYQVEEVSDGKAALDRAGQVPFDLAILDLKMPRMDGMTALRSLKRLYPQLVVLIITAHGNAQVAREAITQGAYDYFTKPFDVNEVRLVVRRAIEKFTLMREIDELQSHLRSAAPSGQIIGTSTAMKDVMQLVERVSVSDVTVLITGESGTGKEVIASAIHAHSPRAGQPMIKVNCAAIPENLLESELFGHERGAFTGAVAQKIGRVELANNGTLFLDEIGDMSLPLQAKLLRMLQEREIERVGGTKSLKVDIRVICATNRNLVKMVEDRTFREDLYYRINVLPIFLPPLRQRRDDIPLLIDHFIRMYNPRLSKSVQGLSSRALEMMLMYPWPGNIRELENTIQRAMLLANSPVLTDDTLTASIRGHAAAASTTEFPQPVAGANASGGSAAGAQGHSSSPSGSQQLSAENALAAFFGEADFSVPLAEKIQQINDKIEARLIRAAIQRTGGHRQQTADLLGISRKSLHNKMVKYGMLAPSDEDLDPGSRSDAATPALSPPPGPAPLA